jgi:hypothetical protein
VEATTRARGPADGGGEIWLAGIGAGVLGALAMMAFMMAAAAVEGDSALDPVAAVGSAFRGSDAERTGAVAVAFGVVLHLALGAVLGVAFAAIVPRDMPLPCSLTLGAGAALFWLAFVVQVTPALAPVLDAEMPRHGGAWVIAHGIFGAGAGIAPWLRRVIGARHGRRREVASRGTVLRTRTSP